MTRTGAATQALIALILALFVAPTTVGVVEVEVDVFAFTGRWCLDTCAVLGWEGAIFTSTDAIVAVISASIVAPATMPLICVKVHTANTGTIVWEV